MTTVTVSPSCKSIGLCSCDGGVIGDACKAPRDYTTAPTTGVVPMNGVCGG